MYVIHSICLKVESLKTWTPPRWKCALPEVDTALRLVELASASVSFFPRRCTLMSLGRGLVRLHSSWVFSDSKNPQPVSEMIMIELLF